MSEEIKFTEKSDLEESPAEIREKTWLNFQAELAPRSRKAVLRMLFEAMEAITYLKVELDKSKVEKST